LEQAYEYNSWHKYTSLSEDQINSIRDIKNTDPFSVLGCHPIDTDMGQMTAIRVYHPTAHFIHGFIPETGEQFDFIKLGDTGFYESILQREYSPLRYKLVVYMNKQDKYITSDPYSFLPVLSDYDLYLIGKGQHYNLWQKLGANLIEHQGEAGVHFAVWAPSARSVSVIGNFNSWDGRRHQMRLRGASGVWEVFIPGLAEGELYKYEIQTPQGTLNEKVDPIAKWSEIRPSTASRVAQINDYVWQDDEWMQTASAQDSYHKPFNIYELHFGSWKRDPGDPERFLTYEEMAHQLVPYVKDMGYTHIELMPLMEHPLDESWGYQVTGYFSTTSRYGSPKQFKMFVDACHKANIGIILDWVPAHFPKDAHSLGRFDGTCLYEHEDPRLGEHPHWGTYIFNYGRNEVSNFLISNALYWLKEFHIDGLRVDAVASMLYLDYGKDNGQWIPNKDGGNVNYEAIEFMKHLNSILRKETPHAVLIAEESTSFPAISRAAEDGGLGYHYKWNMGWMNDFLSYMGKEPIHRKYHHNNLTFSMIYAYSENFILVLSHDEVVHGKGSMVGKMPGDNWQKFANTRLAYSYMYGHPGKKLLFMGSEFGQFSEWNPKQSLDWHLLEWESHGSLHQMVKSLNHTYKNHRALWEADHKPGGFEWINCDDADASIISFVRTSEDGKQKILVVCNFTPVPRQEYRIGAPAEGKWQEIFNSDSQLFGGGNIGNQGERWTESIGWDGKPWSFNINIPPLGAVYFKWEV
jgi:1,4-alpha-glucan branching enzyme